jgi:hypothetical protein
MDEKSSTKDSSQIHPSQLSLEQRQDISKASSGMSNQEYNRGGQSTFPKLIQLDQRMRWSDC